MRERWGGLSFERVKEEVLALLKETEKRLCSTASKITSKRYKVSFENSILVNFNLKMVVELSS